MTQIARRDVSVENWLASPATLSQLKAALPSHFAPDRMARLALTQLRTVRGLADCTPASIMACVMTASQLGLEPGVLGSCYLIPRKGEATFLIGYQGLLDLIRRSGKVTSIASRVVYETDTFEVDYSAAVPFVHKPDLRRKDSRILGFYCHATLLGGEHLFEWMPLHEVQAIRGRSQSGNSGPWATDFAEMGKKTVLRRSIEFSDALAADDRSEFGMDAPPAPAPAPTATVDHEVQAIRGRSQSGNSGPWATDFAEMGKKTVLRRAAKYLPRSIEFSDALAADDSSEFGMDAPPAPAAAPTATVDHEEVRPPAPPSAPSPSSAARLPAPPPPPRSQLAEAVEAAPSSPEVVPFEDDGFPL